MNFSQSFYWIFATRAIMASNHYKFPLFTMINFSQAQKQAHDIKSSLSRNWRWKRRKDPSVIRTGNLALHILVSRSSWLCFSRFQRPRKITDWSRACTGTLRPPFHGPVWDAATRNTALSYQYPPTSHRVWQSKFLPSKQQLLMTLIAPLRYQCPPTSYIVLFHQAIHC